MKIISWNVNGIRAWYKKGAVDWFIKQSPDFMCIQETKAHPDQLEKDFPALFAPEGYHAYFDWSKVRKGYSGVVTYAKEEPLKVTTGLGIKKFDQEGRQVNLFYKNYVVINTYFPNGAKSKDHFEYKLGYYKNFLKFVKKLEDEGYKVIFCGDMNVAHDEIDLARPKENENSIGFLPVERAWIDDLESNGFIDTFRAAYPEKVKYSWWDMKTRARDRNIGWRIDYVFVSK
jgi:exodeoxyribonuclease-3